jgi:hypothetical protein
LIGVPAETGNRHAIVEHVVNPVQPGRLGTDFEGSAEKSLIVAISRAEHHPVLSKANGD